jgi:hypothetical protein
LQGILAAAILHGYGGSTFTSSSTKQSVCEYIYLETFVMSAGALAYAAIPLDMLVILIMVAALSVFRFTASTAYCIVRLVSNAFYAYEIFADGKPVVCWVASNIEQPLAK